jgi:hypothetical protein
MSMLDTARKQPTAVDGAQQIRQVFQNSFRQMEMSLRQVRDIVGRFGRANVEDALGADAKQLASLYAALKTTVESNKPNTKISDLPS